MRRVSYFVWIVALLSASGALLWGAHQQGLGALGAMAWGCAPLAIYHLLILWPRASGGLSQAEVDSVYYFGFLVTIMAMAIGAYSIAASEAPDKNAIVKQFAVGILATAYAIVARMHLASVQPRSEKGDPQVLFEQQVEKSQQVLDHMLRAAVQASALASTLENAQQRIHAHSVDEVRRVLAETSTAFASQMGVALSETATLAMELRRDLERFRAATVDSRMAETMQGIAGAAATLRENADAAAAATLDAATALALTSTELGGVRSQLVMSVRALEVVGDLTARLAQLNQATADLTPSVQAATSELVQTSEQLAAVADQVSTAPRTMKRLADQVERISGGLDFLATVALKVDDAAAGLGSTAEVAQRLRLAMDQITMASPQVASGLSAFGAQAERTTASVKTLGEAADFAANAASGFGDLSAGFTTGAAAVASLDGSVRPLLLTLGSLSNELRASETQLSLTAGQLAGATSEAATAIQRDLVNSSAAASQIADRLVKLVNTIIEQTNRQHGMRT